MKRTPLVLATTLLLTSCADTHQLIRPDSANSLKLDASSSLYIAVPKDGVYGSKIYSGSGLTTAQTVQAAFLRHTNRVRSGNSIQSFDEAIAAARESGSKYLVLPIILHWEDRATEWSGIPDRVEVKIELIEVDTSATKTSAIVKAKSGIATFGGDHPQDLLPEPIEEFVSSLY